jgi:hypothetical protein
MVVIGLVSTCLVYFQLTPFVMEFFTQLTLWGAPEWGTDLIAKCYHVSFIILAVGIILYGLLHSTKDEPDTYKF